MITFQPNRDFASAVAQARTDLEAWSISRNEATPAKWGGWQSDSLQPMLSDREATIQSLQNPDPTVRFAAVSLLAEYWPANELFASDALRLAFEDTEPCIRGAALVALTLLRQYIADPTGFLQELLSELFASPSKAVIADVLHKTREGELGVEQAMNKLWQKAAGPLAAKMLESRDSAESCLTHPEAEIRCAAILALDKHWMSKRELAGLCERLLVKDEDTTVRSLAVALLAGCHVHTDDKPVGDLLARFVCDGSSPHDIRVHAYMALFTVRGMPVEAFLEAASDTFRFPDDVDWPFVNSFLTGE